MLLKTIQTTKLGKHGNRPLSFEEHTIRKWARLAADNKEGGYGIFDATMDHKPAAGLITPDVYSRIAFTPIKHSFVMQSSKHYTTIILPSTSHECTASSN